MRQLQILCIALIISCFGCRDEFERINISETPNDIPTVFVQSTIQGLVKGSEGRVLSGVTETRLMPGDNTPAMTLLG